jgi:monoamine oxidase
VQRIVQTSAGVTIASDTATISARRAIVALPLILAGRLDYDPPLPALRSQLTDRSPLGQGYKWNAVYQEPFWRADGLSGWALNMDGVPEGCADCSPRDGERGVLALFAFGPPARQLAALSADERRRLCLQGLANWFGPKAATPTHFVEIDWTAEKYSRGAIVAHWAPGVLTNFGTALREPCGRIHWAGTETATAWYGSIEGAVRSGERAADEVLAGLEAAAIS